MRNTFQLALLSFMVVTAASAFGAEAKPQGPSRPNIMVIMTDDMGYSDIGSYGSEIQTPNLDALANQGVRFTHFYNTARCCPTRASLLTGLYPHQAGIGHMMNDRGHDGYRGELNRESVTMAEVLRPAGYRTYGVGKWHVTRGTNAKTEAEKFNWPLQRGFDRFYGTISGAGNFWDPNNLVRDNQAISPFADAEYQPQETYYYTDAIADNAVKYMREHQASHQEQPFFMYVTFTAAHWPMHAREEDIAKYKGKYAKGYQAIREARYKRMLELGAVSEENSTLTLLEGGLEGTQDWEWEQRTMEVYAAMIDRMDQGVGKIVAELKAQGELENTLIVYLQDNGACAEEVGRQGKGELKAEAPTLKPIPLDGIRGDYPPRQTRDGFPVRSGRGVMPGATDTWVAYGKSWATVSNTPLREYKHWVHEGGISSPLIVHWPKGMDPAKQGKWESEPGHLIDIMATCVDVGKAEYPKTKNGVVIKPYRGRSLAPLLKPLEKPLETRALFWEHEGNRAVREGQWKWVSKESEPGELYDISKDRSELNNVIAAYPEKAKDLEAKWNKYAAESDVLPLGTWRANPKKASSKTTFHLKDVDGLNREEAPDIEGRSFRIHAKFDLKDNAFGIVLAQGGTRAGYALYIDGGQLIFAVRVDGKLHKLSQPIEKGAHQVQAVLGSGGKLKLKLDQQNEGVSEGVGLLSQPADGLEVGTDSGGLVSDYSGVKPFQGEIEALTLILEKRGK